MSEKEFNPFENKIEEHIISNDSHEFTFANDMGVFSFYGDMTFDINNLSENDKRILKSIKDIFSKIDVG